MQPLVRSLLVLVDVGSAEEVVCDDVRREIDRFHASPQGESGVSQDRDFDRVRQSRQASPLDHRHPF